LAGELLAKGMECPPAGEHRLHRFTVHPVINKRQFTSVMKSSSLISLFETPPPSRRAPSSFFISLVLHVFAFALLYVGLNQPHKVDLRSNVDRYAVRIMELHRPEPKERRVSEKAISAPGQGTETHAAATGGGPAGATAARIPLNFLTQKRAVQTLIQPDVHRDLLLPQEVPLPQVVQWTPPDPVINKIVPPPPKPVAEIKVQPTLDPPNQEVRVADLKLSASQYDTKAPLPAPSKTSPMNVQAPVQAQKVPETASKNSGKATPASIISLTEIKLQDGATALPMISEVAPTPFTGSLAPGQPKGTSQSASGKTDSNQNGASAGLITGDQAGKAGTASASLGKSGPAGRNGANGLAGESDGNASGNSQRAVVHISEPKDGKFGVVVVGSSLAEDYPETVDMWHGRLAYTVYLHIGASKNWILQFSVPRSQGVSLTGSAGRPDAPWPYDITRPTIDANTNANAIMVHGFVNTSGRFEELAVVFPTELAETKFLLHALQQWQFRPAMQNGQATPVEVLLIIPDETE
jgi:hypothetical protein